MKQGEIIETATVKKIRKFLDRTAKNSQMSFLFGPTGRGKTFTIQDWLTQHPEGVYLRADADVTTSRLRKQLSYALFRTDSGSRQDIVDYLLQRPGAVVIVDEAVHICSETFSAQDVKRLDSLRDVFDNVNENGGALGMCLVFTDCTLARFKNGRGARFLGQFVGRMENHLNLGDRISMAYEIKPVLRAYGFDESLADAAFRIANESGKMRTLYKCIQLAEKVAKKKSIEVSAELLNDVFHQIETGSHPDE